MSMNTSLPEIIPLELAAIWGAFLYEGLMAADTDDQVFAVWGQGGLELITEVCRYLPLLWQVTRPHWHRNRDFPGVFEYEVVAVFGRYLGEYLLEHDGELPGKVSGLRTVTEMVTAFFDLSSPYHFANTSSLPH